MNANFWPRVDVLAGLSIAKCTMANANKNIKNNNRTPNIFPIDESKEFQINQTNLQM